MATIGAAIGMSSYDRGEDNLRNFALVGGMWGLVSTVVAFVVGGYVAGRSSPVFARHNGLSSRGVTSNGVMNGVLVAAVAIPLMLYIAGSAATSMAAAEIANNRGVSDRAVADRARVDNAATVTTPVANENASADRTRNADGARDDAAKTAWTTLIGMILALAAAAAGGYFSRRDSDTGERATHTTGREHTATNPV